MHQSNMNKKKQTIDEITLTFRPLVFCVCNKMNYFDYSSLVLSLEKKSIRHCASLLSLSIQPKVPHPVHQRPRGRWENAPRLRDVDTGAGTSASAQMNSQLMWFQEKPPVNVWPHRVGLPRNWLGYEERKKKKKQKSRSLSEPRQTKVFDDGEKSRHLLPWNIQLRSDGESDERRWLNRCFLKTPIEL